MKTIKRKGAISWMAGNSVASNILMALIILGGIFFTLDIKKEVFPNFSIDRVAITIPYPGATPEEVEKGALLATEEAISSLEGIDTIESTAQTSVGVVIAKLFADANHIEVLGEIKQELDRITSYPDAVEDPQVVYMIRETPCLSVMLYGDTTEKNLFEISETVRDSLLKNKEITKVTIGGTNAQEIAIEISSENLRKYNLTIDDISSKINRNTGEIPGGSIKSKSGTLMLKTNKERFYGEDFLNTPIKTTEFGKILRLSDVAIIKDSFEENDKMVLYNNKPSTVLTIFSTGGASPTKVASITKKEVKKLVLPDGINAEVQMDISKMYDGRMDLLLRNAKLGLILVLITLALFLDTKLAFWVTMGIPISFLGAFLVLPSFGMSLNMVSLFAFLISLGIVVDDAVIVGENIFAHREKGKSWKNAAMDGAREVAMPVFFSVATNIVAFVPMFFVPGMMGKVFQNIPSVVVLVFFFSLIESLFILPAHLNHGSKQFKLFNKIHNVQQKVAKTIMGFFTNIYKKILAKVLLLRYPFIASAIVVLLVVIGYIKSGVMGFKLFPKVESDYAVVNFSLPYGIDASKTKEVAELLLKEGMKVGESFDDAPVEGVMTTIGSRMTNEGPKTMADNFAQIMFFLKSSEIRETKTQDFINKWSKITPSLQGIENISFIANHGAPGSGQALTVELRHKNIKTLEKASGRLEEKLNSYSEVSEIDNGFSPGNRQYEIILTEKGEKLNLTNAMIGTQIRNAFYGKETVKHQRGRHEVKTMIRLPRHERENEWFMENLLIKTPAGKLVSIKEVAEIKKGTASKDISRRNGERRITVTAKVRPEEKNIIIVDELKTDFLPKLTEEIKGLSFSFEGKQADMKDSMAALFKGFGLAIIAIFGLLAIPLRSYIQPLMIMISIPFGIIGAIIGHMIMGYGLSILSMFGIVALSGVVVNDSLILLTTAKRNRDKGLSAFDAITKAGKRRLRPIILTTITTFGGLMPMIFETSMQAKFLIPMAISLGFGILFATIITLLLIPCMYLSLDDISRFMFKDVEEDKGDL